VTERDRTENGSAGVNGIATRKKCLVDMVCPCGLTSILREVGGVLSVDAQNMVSASHGWRT
jgi:hypothetical protein